MPSSGNATLDEVTNCLPASVPIPGTGGWFVLPPNDDGSLGPINLGFQFSMYGANYSSVYINNNGNLTFGGSLSSFTPAGFPISTPMVAAFWADVDTRDCGQVFYRVLPTRLEVYYYQVGYFSRGCDLKNSFQVIITSNTDAQFLSTGNNVFFNYGDMQWFAGQASSGSSATVGINSGNNVNFVQVGRFGNFGDTYDGPSGQIDGINYLDNKCFSFNVTGTTNNIPPSFTGLPTSNDITLQCGQALNLNIQAIAPEVNQTLNVTYTTDNLCNATVSVVNSGSISNISIVVPEDNCATGVTRITLTARDNGTPVGESVYSLTIRYTPKPIWYKDADNDGYSSGETFSACELPAGFKAVGDLTSMAVDCNDNVANINPGANEICGNGIDDNCNIQVDEGCTGLPTWYRDKDGDGRGRTSNSKQSAVQPVGYVNNNHDCNDGDPTIYLNAPELPDGKDNDCDGLVDEDINLNCPTWYRDEDGDGKGRTNLPKISCVQPLGYVNNATDCNDGDITIYLGAPELPDGKDNDCDGQVDEGFGCPTWYRDADGDGRGRTNITKISCVQPVGYANNTNDCNDGDASIYLGAPEICDGKDNDCDGIIDEECPAPITANESTRPAAKSDVVTDVFTINLWPNPARSELMVSLNGITPNQKLEMVMMTADGRAVQSQSLTPVSKDQQVRINVRSLSTGYYLLRISQEKLMQTKKVMIVQ